MGSIVKLINIFIFLADHIEYKILKIKIIMVIIILIMKLINFGNMLIK